MKQGSHAAGLAVLFLSATLAGACSPGPNPKDQVDKGLKAAQINDVNLDYDMGDKVLHLKGEVKSASESARAESIAAQVVGTSGRVANELTVKGVNDRTADDMDGTIRRELNAKIANDRALMDRSINFDVNNGVVTIKGEVKTEAERQMVSDFAKGTANVRDTVNALTIDPSLERPTATTGTVPPTPAREMPDPKRR